MKHLLYLAAPAIVGAALLCLPAPSSAAANAVGANAVIGEFATPSAASSPQGVDVAGDGSVWYSETTAGKIAVLRPDGSSAEFPVPNGGQPFILKVADDGIWFTDSGTRAIGHLDPATGTVETYAIPSGASPFFIQVGPDGSKWFTETAGIGRLSPNGEFTEWTVTLEHADDNMEQLSLDPWGNVWFVERNFDGIGAAGTNKVRRLNPYSNVISTYRVPTLGGTPSGVVANANGSVWVSEYYANAIALLNPFAAPHSDEVVQPNALKADSRTASMSPIRAARTPGAKTQVTPSAHAVKPSVTLGWIEYPLPSAKAEPEDMRVDRHGRVWFEADAGFIGRLDPFEARITEYMIPSANSGYYNIALDPRSGLLWFTEAGVFAPVTTKIGYLDTRH
ncbi:antibiotic hydrolase [Ralstonia pseudosolanacearum]|uniref:Vgb family protein n=1 Tax=Ralstonia pseudosolanacearum TaxID=1310165 RepID=UPI0026765F19|nr:antibiotic hydrolase [Ralstonia pseudosolanacearum]MDO3528708.1 antibiotic hydrolase [Ralstonia pseudosolanacearum]MDO3533822.1 antibiotic hydrolase [Ralstonia pseudosolanacearum]